MEREKIVGEFFRRGHLLTDDAVKIIEEKGLEEFISRPLPLVVDIKDLHPAQYRIIKNLTAKKSELTTDDFVRFSNSRYEKMRGIITSRLRKDFISINKLDSTRAEVYVIGIVRDIREKDGKKIVELEDPTARISAIFEDTDDLEPDDIVAVQAVAGGKVLFGKKVLYPDIPLRNPATGTGRACFISDIRLDESPQRDAERFFEWFSQQDIPYLFVSGRTGGSEILAQYIERYCHAKTVFVISGGDYPQLPDKYSSMNIISLSDPAMVEVGGLKVLMAQKADIKMLKKRHLGRSQVILDEDYLSLEDVPDIVHSGHSADHYVTNYKSVTLVNSGSLLGDFRPIVIDFATRDVEKVLLNK